MTLTILNPATGNTETRHLPSCDAANPEIFRQYYRSRGLVVIEIRYDAVSI